MGKNIRFRSIPCFGDRGHIALSIYPPDQFIGNKGFDAFVGGCGVGSSRTLASAKVDLLSKALLNLRRRISSARAEADWYEARLFELEREGLVPTEED